MSLLVSRAIVLCFNAFLTWPRAALGMPGVGRECTTHRFHRNHIKGLFKSAEEKRDSCVSGMGGGQCCDNPGSERQRMGLVSGLVLGYQALLLSGQKTQFNCGGECEGLE